MVPVHIKFLVQSNTTRQVLKKELLLCDFSGPMKRDSNMHRCFRASPGLALVKISRNLTTMAHTV